MRIYERNINVKVEQPREGIILVVSSLLDLDHNMVIEMEIDVNTKEVLQARGENLKTPFAGCNFALNNVKRLVGIKIERGLIRQLNEIFGRETGCNHLYEVALAACRLAAIILLGLKNKGMLAKSTHEHDEQLIEGLMPALKNTCIIFKAHELSSSEKK